MIISRGKLHQELTRSQGKLTTQFKRDPLGRLAQQLAELEGSHTSLVQRTYEYDLVGNLIQTQDTRFGTTNYRYDKLGQIQLAGQELFQFDPAHNIIEQESERIQNNQVTHYQGITYRYDEFGNLSQRTFPNGEVQRYAYNAKDKLVETIIQKPNKTIETWQYQYDVLGRRIGKRLESRENLQETRFIWDCSHLVQEIDHKTDRTYSYIYSHPSSYEPLAQLAFSKNSENLTACTTYYYHNDQIGVPRELTDEQGKLCWYANYSGWGKVKEDYDLTKDKSIHQPFRYKTNTQTKKQAYIITSSVITNRISGGLRSWIRLGGNNLYTFAINIYKFIDVLGVSSCSDRILASANKLNYKKEYGYRYSNAYNDLWNKKMNKCNLFVHDVLLDAKVEAPQRYKFGIIPLGPIQAGDWANAEKDIPGFKIVTEPAPGDIVAIAFPYEDATGHVGIVSKISEDQKESIGASTYESHSSSWPWDKTKKLRERQFIDVVLTKEKI